MKKLYKVSFYAEMDEEDVGAVNECLADAVKKELHIDAVGTINVTRFATLCKNRDEDKCDEPCEGFDNSKDCYIPT